MAGMEDFPKPTARQYGWAFAAAFFPLIGAIVEICLLIRKKTAERKARDSR